MPYQGLITIDFTGAKDNNEYQRMEAALVAGGWEYVETSAFTYSQPTGEADADALKRIWQGIAIVGRASSGIGGKLSALSFTVQRIDDTKRKQRVFGSADAGKPKDYKSQPFPGDQ